MENQNLANAIAEGDARAAQELAFRLKRMLRALTR